MTLLRSGARPARWLCALLLQCALVAACGGPTGPTSDTPVETPPLDTADSEPAPPPPTPNRPLCSDPTTFDRQLELSEESRELAMHGGEVHRFPVHLEAGQYLEVNADQHGIDVYLALFGPSGERLMTTDRPTSRLGIETLSWIAETTADYEVLACAWGRSDIEGKYLLSSTIATPPSPRQAARTAAALEVHEAQKLWRSHSREHAVEIESHLRRALDDLLGFEAVGLEAEILYRLVRVLQNSGNQPEASSALQRLLPLLEGPENRNLLISVKRRLASVLMALFQFEEAAIQTKEALEIARAAQNDRQIGLLLRDIAEYHNYRGEYLESFDYFDRALDFLKSTGDDHQIAVTLDYRANVFKAVGQRQQAIDDLEAALAIQSGLGNRSVQANLLATKAVALRDLLRFSEAKETIHQAHAIYSELGDDLNRGRALTSLASIFIFSEENEAALETCYEALDLLSPSWSTYDRAILLHNTGWTLKALARYSESLEYLQQSLTLFDEVQDFRRASVTLLALAQIQRSLGEADKALDYSSQAVSYIEKSRERVSGFRFKASLLTTRQAQYDEHIQILMDRYQATGNPHYARSAFVTSEQSRARSQLDEILTRRRSGTDTSNGSQAIERDEIQGSISDLERYRISLLESGRPPEEIELVERRLRGLIRDYGVLDAQIQEANGQRSPRGVDISLDDIQAALDAESGILELHLGRDRSFVWLVQRDKLSVYPLAGQQQIERLARRAHDLLSRSYQRRLAHQTNQVLWDLSQLLLAPIEEELPRRVLVSSDGALDYIPFGVLPTDTPANAKDGNGDRSRLRAHAYEFETLGQTHEVIRIPSASILLALRAVSRERGPDRASLLMVADPVFSRDDERLSARVEAPGPSYLGTGQGSFDRLFYSKMEAEAVLAAVPGDSAQSLSGFSAANEEVLAAGLGNYRFIHFATHGVLDSEYPELSRLVLSQFDEDGNPIPGFLFTHQIDKLDLEADLVVLSACDTALGTEIKGEGLVGLPQAFMVAGASSVVVSSWAIDDETTAELMSLFYSGMLEEGLNIPTALQRAQNEIRKQKPAPFYWAGFSFLGDWKNQHKL